MSFIGDIIMLGGEILGTLVFLIFIVALILWILWNLSQQDKNQRRAQEKVMELTEKGHDAKVCPKCKGKGKRPVTWEACAECGGLGYIYKLREHAEVARNADDVGGLEKCANCGRAIGKLEKSYLFEDHVVCGECHQRLKSQK